MHVGGDVEVKEAVRSGVHWCGSGLRLEGRRRSYEGTRARRHERYASYRSGADGPER
ncbi:hypothetical protein [Streptomyces sp. NPDC058953]|uniref:hypothetical protein n=1 Tax=Streptomyces sp. NPDC058953 TaxID=3346676 RepID=UPI0036A9376E